ncbi:MAG TPA: topoisomerase C-terminal repeat-containing protein, partial [Trichocoleus sp.]
YSRLVNNSLVPTFTAFAVTSLLEKHFPDLVDVSFTARMEQTLDEISTGEVDWLPYLRAFYRGEEGLENQVHERESQIDPASARTVELADLDARVRIGRYGPYIEVENGENGEEPIKASIPQDVPPADLDIHQIERILKQKVEGPDKVGLHPETGEPIYMRIGPYGPYVQIGEKTDDNPNPKRASLPKGVNPDDMTLEVAVGLLALPRLLGVHPETGAPIKASQGRFGPYIVHDQGKEGKDYRSLKKDDDVLSVTLERALDLLSEPKSGRGRKKSAEPLRELGKHPEDEEMVAIFKGPYGHYVKHGKTNASLPEGAVVEEVTLEQALEWLSSKEGGKKKAGARKSSTRTTKTAAASKTTTAKKTTRKSTTAKSTATKSATKSAAAKSSSARSTKASTEPDETSGTAKSSTKSRSTKSRSTKSKAAE